LKFGKLRQTDVVVAFFSRSLKILAYEQKHWASLQRFRSRCSPRNNQDL